MPLMDELIIAMEGWIVDRAEQHRSANTVAPRQLYLSR